MAIHGKPLRVRILSLGSGCINTNNEIDYTPSGTGSRSNWASQGNRNECEDTNGTIKLRASTLSTAESSDSAASDFPVAPHENPETGLPIFCIDKCNDKELLGYEASLPRFTREEELNGVKEMILCLSEEEKKELTDPTMIIRHFRAEKGNPKRALQSLRAALHWRREFQVNRLRVCMRNPTDKAFQDMMSLEDKTGKVYVRGVTADGRAMIYMKAMNNNTPHAEEDNMRHLVWNIEKAICVTRHRSGGRLDKYCLLVDCANFRMSKTPSVAVSKFTLDILQKHFPERMYRAYVLNPPLAFRMFWNLIKAFIDPVTKTKIVFVTDNSPGLEQMHQEIGQIAAQKLEKCAFGRYSVREFDSKEHLNLPMHIPFDDENLNDVVMED